MGLYVNGELLPQSLIEAETQRMRPAYEQAFAGMPQEEREKQLAAWARENVIEGILLRQQARAERPVVEEAAVEQALAQFLRQESHTGPLHQRMDAGEAERAKVRQEIADRIRHERLTERINRGVLQPGEKAIGGYYRKHIERFTIPEMVHAAHIVKHAGPDSDAETLKSQIDAIYQQLESGTPFEELAAQHSDCPDSGGSLGFFPRGRMVPAFEEIVFGLKEGTYSEPFETEFGWHIAKVIKKQAVTVCPLEEVRQVIVRDLTQEAQQAALEAFLDGLRAKAVVEER